MSEDFNKQILDLEKKDDLAFGIGEIAEWETTKLETESENEYEQD